MTTIILFVFSFIWTAVLMFMEQTHAEIFSATTTIVLAITIMNEQNREKK